MKAWSAIGYILLGGGITLALQFWLLNHSQCQGLVWHGETGLPAMQVSDRMNCMRIDSSGKFEGVWLSGRENSFVPNSDRNGDIDFADGLPLFYGDAARFLIHEEMGLDPYTPHKLKISFYGNVFSNHNKGYSPWRNHIEIKKIESIEVVERNPLNR